jgi:hypothetical protein
VLARCQSGYHAAALSTVTPTTPTYAQLLGSTDEVGPGSLGLAMIRSGSAPGSFTVMPGSCGAPPNAVFGSSW